jgi:hypothetical protein
MLLLPLPLKLSRFGERVLCTKDIGKIPTYPKYAMIPSAKEVQY